MTIFKKLFNFIKEREWLAVLVAALVLSFVFFGNSLQNDFVFDDNAVVKNRGDLQDPSLFLNLFVSPYHQNIPKTGLYRPLTMATYAVNHYLGGSAFGFHLVNIFLQALNSFLVFWLVRYFLKSKSLAWTSFLLFLAHPLHTEAVTSIVGRAELLAFLWSMATVYFYTKKYQLLAGLSFLLALWSKETALMLLPVLLYLEIYFDGKTFFASFKKLSFLAFPLGVYSVFRYMALGKYFAGDATTTIVENQLKFVGFFERIFTALKILAMYVERLIWPFRLSADYSYRRISLVGNLLKSPEAWLGLFLLGGLVWLAIRFKKEKQALGLGAVLFLFPYLMISNLIQPVGTIMGERLMYFPSLGFVIILACLLDRLIHLQGPTLQESYPHARLDLARFSLVLLVILMFYGVRTIIRNRDWKDNQTLFTATVKESPNSLITRTALAGLHIKANEWPEAKQELTIASGIYENDAHLQNLLGIVADHDGHPELAETKFNQALELNPEAVDVRINLAKLYLKYGQLEPAAVNFLKVIEFYPVPEYILRYAYAEIALHHPDEAIQALFKYAGGSLKHPDLSAAMGTAYFVKGDYKSALAYLKNAKELGNKAPEVEKMIQIAEKKINGK